MNTRDKLDALSKNLWWSWHPRARGLFRRLNPEVYAAAGNSPQAALENLDPEVLADATFQADVDAVYARFQDYMDRAPLVDDAPTTAYFCMEYGLHESLPLYSGGLGVLAGDHAKTASDVGLPFTAVGLFLREGYFKQSFDAEGWQQDDYPALDPDNHPMTRVTDDDGDPLMVTVQIGEQPLHVQAWKIALGRTDLYLLDSDLDANPEALRSLTTRLYQGGDRERIQQEIILGIGGLRLLRALGETPEVYHANEGHCAFLMLELLRERLDAGDPLPDAEAWVRERTVFTTHTPVPAGHDRFAPPLFEEQMAPFRKALGLSSKELLAYGREDPSDATESFCMTVLGLKLSRAANGVSKLNGHVARQQWQGMYPEKSLDEVPIGHITNGVHLPTWTAEPARAFLREHLSGDFETEQHKPSFWAPLGDLDDETLWHYRTMLRKRLIAFIDKHVKEQTLPQQPALNPDALTIGFARRFATYKRAPLIFTDLERARALFSDSERPIQLIYAGKAHPADDGGKRFIQRIYEISQQPGFHGKVIFLEGYNMEIGRMLVSGSDIWLNNPRRPLEASGTSGQKVAAHGGLNLSVLDGWWPEGYTGDNGWAIGPEPTGDYGTADAEVQDEQDAESLYTQLEEHVIPTFYDRTDGIPEAWVAQMRNAMTGLPAPFSAQRMVFDYVEQMYRTPALS
ncbi:alpha-glucan family phosphorylase [Salisaeta longa]|uniref:alpha-glucan family phosphorylase n=1 Tax=Salisaeta longa TaxID=503170 RepID=UPI0003B4E079|nr:alpha-glucan family phosphorylase [Salisaeta longa]